METMNPIIEKLGAQIDRSRKEFEALKEATEKFRIQSKQLERLALMAGFSVGVLTGIVIGAVSALAWVRA